MYDLYNHNSVVFMQCIFLIVVMGKRFAHSLMVAVIVEFSLFALHCIDLHVWNITLIDWRSILCTDLSVHCKTPGNCSKEHIARAHCIRIVNSKKKTSRFRSPQTNLSKPSVLNTAKSLAENPSQFGITAACFSLSFVIFE